MAATEFVIGALLVSFGASATDIVLGLLLGNLLAVLSWTFVCAPIAVATRLTLYWYLRRIAGPGVTLLYNLCNAVMYCILAGAMITVSASAVRLLFGIPAQTKWYPEDLRFVLVVLVVGAVVVTLAILGFKRLAQFAVVCAPWMVLMFVAGAIVMLPSLAAILPDGKIDGLADLWTIANQTIWKGASEHASGGIGFWHVVAFAWICNLAMHVGLSDMAIFRFARKSSYGLFSAFGMFVGHYMAWICAGIMGAAAAFVAQKPLAQLDSGDVASQALGVSGALAVVIAGWTTANPTLYRAGLALQVVTPNWPRWKVTLIAGGGHDAHGLLAVRVHEAPRLRGGLRPAAHAGRGDRVRRALDLPADRLHAVLGQPQGADRELAGPRRLARLGRPRRGGLAERVDPPVLPGAPRVGPDRGRLHRARRGGRGPRAAAARGRPGPAAAGVRCGRAHSPAPRTAAWTVAALVTLATLVALLVLPLWVFARGRRRVGVAARHLQDDRGRDHGRLLRGRHRLDEREREAAGRGSPVMPKVVVALLNAEQEFQQLQAKDARESAARLELDVEVVFAEGHAVVQIQQLFKHIHAPEAERPVAIVVEAATGEGLERVARNAVNAGIGWILVNARVAYVDELRREHPDLPIAMLGTDQREVGRIQGRQCRALLPGGGNVLCVQGPADSTVTLDRLEGLKEALGTGFEVRGLNGDWTEASGEKAVVAWLRLKTAEAFRPDLVVCQNDSMAAGARKAIRGHRRSGRPCPSSAATGCRRAARGWWRRDSSRRPSSRRRTPARRSRSSRGGFGRRRCRPARCCWPRARTRRKSRIRPPGEPRMAS